MTLDQNSYRKDLHENKITPKPYCNPRSSPARRTCRWRGRRRFSTDAWIGRRPLARGLSSNLEIRRSSIRHRQPPPGPDLPPDLRRTRTGSAAPDSGRGRSRKKATRTSSAREETLHRGPPPSPTADEDKRHLQNQLRPRLRRQSATVLDPANAYTIYTLGIGVPPTSRRRSGRRRGGEPASRRR